MIGQTLSHFKITAKLGEGGMGEVYRAEDTRLGREVAIKMLPEAFTSDPERLARFEREAKVLASLNHPNIAGIHQIEQVDGKRLLVMELVEGEDLSSRMSQGSLGAEEATGIAIQIAEGLQVAHEQGIVHRDLKPANVKITPGGQVKILDFGLAKAWEQEEASPDMTRSPTLTAQMTQAGVILGTAGYMSPEQARGQEADQRADIWALGVVLYEMLTGSRLFAEPTVSDTLAAVLRADFDWASLPAGVSSGTRRVLRRCLEREPGRRYHAAADVRIELEEARGAADSPTPSEAPRVGRLPWLLAVTATAAALLLGFLALRPVGKADSAPASRLVTSILPPPAVELVPDRHGIAISPDGTQLAFVGRDDSGTFVWVRSLERGSERKIPGTEDAEDLFWAPDGSSLGFFQHGSLMTVDLETGFRETLVEDFTFAGGGTWNDSGDIVFGSDDDIPLRMIKSTGGEVVPVTEQPAAGDFYFAPDFLPDGNHFIFHARRYGSEAQVGQIRLGSLAGEPSRVLFETHSTARFVKPGFILWWHQENLRAQRFDMQTLEMTGEPIAVASGVRFDPRSAFAAFTVSDTGLLLYLPGERTAGNQLTWYARDGLVLGTVGDPGSLYSPRISPDGSRIALDISGDSNQGDIWVLDIERGSGQRVTIWPEDDSLPVWSPDGSELAFFSTRRGGDTSVYRVSLSGGSEPEFVYGEEGVPVTPRDWTEDGGTLVLRAGHPGKRSILSLSLENREQQTILAGALIDNPSLSPDGEWLIYESDETGEVEVYLTDFPGASQRFRVSTAGGFSPLWSSDGDEVFYASVDSDALFAVAVTIENDRPIFGPPERLFSMDMKQHAVRQFDTRDGQRFLVNANIDSATREPLTAVLNWIED